MKCTYLCHRTKMKYFLFSKRDGVCLKILLKFVISNRSISNVKEKKVQTTKKFKIGLQRTALKS